MKRTALAFGAALALLGGCAPYASYEGYYSGPGPVYEADYYGPGYGPGRPYAPYGGGYGGGYGGYHRGHHDGDRSSYRGNDHHDGDHGSRHWSRENTAPQPQANAGAPSGDNGGGRMGRHRRD